MYVMLEQYHFLKCEEQFFSSNIINSPYRGLRKLRVMVSFKYVYPYKNHNTLLFSTPSFIYTT